MQIKRFGLSRGWGKAKLIIIIVIFTPHFHPFSYFFLSLTHLVQIISFALSLKSKIVDIIFTKKTLCIPSPKSCLFCGLNLVGLLCCFLGKTLYSHSTSLNPGVKMGTAALPGKPVMKCLGVTLQWTCISSTGLSLCYYLLHAVKTEMGFISWVS